MYMGYAALDSENFAILLEVLNGRLSTNELKSLRKTDPSYIQLGISRYLSRNHWL